MRPLRLVELLARAAVLVVAAGCATDPSPGPIALGEVLLPAGADAAPSLEGWRWARHRLDTLRRQGADTEPRTLRIALALREPVTGRTVEARGAIALAPPKAMRMILLGPGGTTALDLWSKDDRFRFEVPAIDLLRRGDARTPAEATRGLPVEFLRWWLLRPLGGTLLWYGRRDDIDHFLLRDGVSVVRVAVAADGRVLARRTTPGAGRGGGVEEETVEAARLGCGTARYRQASTDLEISVRCEGREARAPNPAAFEDPDAAGSPPRAREATR